MEMRATAMRVEPALVSHEFRPPAHPVQGERRSRLREVVQLNWVPIAILSLALHLATGVAILDPPAWLLGARPVTPPVYAQVEMVDLPLSGVGDGPQAKREPDDPSPQAAAPPPAPQVAPPDTSARSAAPEPAAAAPVGEVAVPPPAPPAAAAKPDAAAAAAPPADLPAQQKSAPPETRLDDSMDFGRALVRNVIPAGPDSTVHNDPPAYPRLAARYGEAGTVRLMVLVAPDGSARNVQVTESSGYERLDRAALEAVAKWHFRPGQQDGIAIESYYPVNVQFDLGDK